MENAVSKERLNRAKEKSKRDSLVLESMSHIVVCSESIMKALNNIQQSGSTLYRHNYKRLTKQYRKECMSTLNNYYDLMETGGVADAVLNDMKKKAAIYSVLPELTDDQIHRLGLFVTSMLGEEEGVLEVVEKEEEKTQESSDVESNDILDESIEEDVEEKLLEEEEEDGYAAILGEDADLENFKDPLEDEIKMGDDRYELNKEASITIDQYLLESTVESFSLDGGFEEDILKKSVDSIAVRNGIDTSSYVFSKADKLGDGKINLIFKLIE